MPAFHCASIHKLIVGVSFGILCEIGFITTAVIAQITPDDSLGPESSRLGRLQQINGLNSREITGGAERQNRLFHSFKQFNIPQNFGAYFRPGSNITQIFTRVTGGNVSRIDGTLGVLNSTANLFLINPQGILFGPNASLDLNGSFVATTADQVTFGDTAFSAVNPGPIPQLAINLPIGLSFRQQLQNTGKIKLQASQLAVQPRSSLHFISRELLLANAQLLNPQGSINLTGTGSNPLELSLNSETFSPSANSVLNGNITLTDTIVDTSGPGGGEITVLGDRVLLKNSSLEAITLGVEDGLGITIFANSLESFQSAILSSTNDLGSAGNILIDAQDILFDGQGNSNLRAFIVSELGGAISARLFGFPDLPALSRADQRANFQITSGSTGPGRGGELTIRAQNLQLQNGAFISTGSRSLLGGSGGDTSIEVQDTFEIRGSNILTSSFGSENAGDLTITTKKLLISQGGGIATSVLGDSRGGDLIINAADTIRIFDSVPESELPEGIASTALLASGTAGDIRIKTSKLIIEDGTQITASSGSPDLPSFGVRSSGDINLNVTETIEISGSGDFRSGVTNTGFDIGSSAGDIQISTNLLRLQDNAIINTDTQSNEGGNISLNITNLVALQNSDITSNASQGSGGLILINAEGIFGPQFRSELTNFSDITAFSELDPQLNGVVELNTPEVDPARNLVELPEDIVDPAALITQNACDRKQQDNKFVVLGRGGLPLSPENLTRQQILSPDLIPLETVSAHPNIPVSAPQTSPTMAPALPTPARSWEIDGNQVTLLAAASAPSRLPFPTTDCRNEDTHSAAE
ncbi:MAG: filamentous hemagglutinin N-terminal domain-containing protein [Cyanobacteria bacterium P01_H01_bin.15]